ncbi:MAG TPA: transposase [Candidatus Paceibacterota bacterium]|nr:transposase [Verrucomicrobiota bacterium]HRY48989.1 transposase [Candidatus Paceibacterota bacterium]HSA00797.1 transposase [Candidatus Paceibacterota bacterium]
MKRKGYRTRQATWVTTLLDPIRYPGAALAELYYRRWEVELSLRHLKTTLQMEHLSCKTSANVERELRMHFLVHNLVRRLMLEAARRHRVPLGRISFAGGLAGARRCPSQPPAIGTQSLARKATKRIKPRL